MKFGERMVKVETDVRDLKRVVWFLVIVVLANMGVQVW